MRVLCCGANHRTAPIEVRERLALDPAGVREQLAALRARWPDAELLLLSTCNRTELYAVRPVHERPRAENLRRHLEDLAGEPLPAASLYERTDAEALRHLFRVAAGLDSLVPGEGQIVAQLKDAFTAALEQGASRSLMNRTVETALHVAKHVRTETGLASGKVSVASVAVELVRQVFEDLTRKTILSIGAGKMNQLMLAHLTELHPGQVLIANRSPERAEALARCAGGRPVAFEDLGEHLAAADVVLTSTGADEPVLGAEAVRTAQKARNWRPLLIVDIAVPRDVSPAAGELDSVFLYNVDDLQAVVERTLGGRRDEFVRAERIVERHVEELQETMQVRDAAPTIRDLYRRMRRIADDELEEAAGKFASHPDAEEDMIILRRTLHRTLRKVLHPVARNLRKDAGREGARSRLATIRRLFGLDE